MGGKCSQAFRCSSTSVYYTECKLKNKNGGGLEQGPERTKKIVGLHSYHSLNSLFIALFLLSSLS